MEGDFTEGAWYWSSDGSKWKVRYIMGSLVLARRRWGLFTRVFIFDEKGEDIVWEEGGRLVMIRPEWRCRRWRGSSTA